MKNISPLQHSRLKYKPKIVNLLRDITKVSIEIDEKKNENISSDNQSRNEIKSYFPKTYSNQTLNLKKTDTSKKTSPIVVGVVFSGGQAPGGHNVIAGLFDGLKQLNIRSKLIGFLNGPSGLIDMKFVQLEKTIIDNYRNLGGFDLIGSGRTKIETDEQLEKSLITAKKLNLDGIVIIGGDDSNTNAAVLAEYFKKNEIKTKVIGVPKTIDGDLKTKDIEISFGFDTACKVYSELIGNIAKDALSAKKYYHFIRLMGRSASHIAIECAIKTQPNLCFIAEEVFEKKKTLKSVVLDIVDLIEKRSDINKNFGVILVPEGLIEFIPEFKDLISKLNQILASGSKSEGEFNNLKTQMEKFKFIESLLVGKILDCFKNLPNIIKEQLLLDRDPHGNVKVSQIETEKLLIQMVKQELKKRDFSGKFNALSHFFGYEGRSGMPSNFDANYCYNLGLVSAILINENLTGFISCLSNLTDEVENWVPKAVSITSLLNIEKRHGEDKPVIKKALVDLDSKAFRYLQENKDIWALKDLYLDSGAIQYFGENQIIDEVPKILKIKD